MVVFDHGVKGRLAMARAHCKEGEFPGERHEALQDEMELGKLGFSFHNVVCGAQDPLPLAVIAHPASLEHGGKAKLPDGGVKFAGFRNGEKIGGCDAEIAKEGFLSEPILRRFESSGRRIDRNALGKELRCFDGDVLEFVGDKFQPIRKFLKRRVIAVVGGDALGDAAHRSFRRRVKKAEMQAERIAGQREHVPELSAAENAQGHCRFPFCEFFMGTATAETEGSGCARTRSACSTRNFRNASRISGCFAPRIAAASRFSFLRGAFVKPARLSVRSHGCGCLLASI